MSEPYEVCRNCRCSLEDHTREGKCLYAPTMLEPHVCVVCGGRFYSADHLTQKQRDEVFALKTHWTCAQYEITR